MDRVTFWNVRGLNASNKQQELQHYCRINKVGFLGLIESKLKKRGMEICHAKHFNLWCLTHNLDHHARGRIWVLWQPIEYEVDVLDTWE